MGPLMHGGRCLEAPRLLVSLLRLPHCALSALKPARKPLSRFPVCGSGGGPRCILVALFAFLRGVRTIYAIDAAVP